MHWNKRRLAPTDGNNNGSKRYSSLFPSYASRHSEHVPRPAVSTSQLDRRLSDSGPRPNLADAERHDARPDDSHPSMDPVSHGDKEGENDPTGTSPRVKLPERRQSLKRNRFSMLRFRHASDPQLSSTYAQSDPNIPPVPNLRVPPPPPTIITTAPTNSNLDKARKNKLRMPLAKKLSQEALGLGLAGRNSVAGEKIDRTMSGPTRISHEDPARLSTSSFRSGNASSQPDRDARVSESSRSERSSGERASAKAETSHPPKKFTMLRLKKSRGPLFPLPVKIPPPGTTNSPSDTTGRSSIDPNTPERDHLSPLPSPTQSSVRLSSPKGNHPPHLFRNDSTTSARSVNSSSSAKARLGRRGRSSTLNSLIDARRPDDPQNSSLNLASGRTSTSTSGRKSFGDLFHFSHRSRQNSVSPGQRDGYPSPRPPGTPGSDSKIISGDLLSIPDREESDTPTTYLSKLQEAVHKGAIATILSKSDDDFDKVTLRKFMRTFVFFGEPIDMAIRKLLMEVELPKETQQIDRVLQSFADRYYECNPGIFVSTDQTYFIAFSILILHTDVFNKNNKRKMQKPDYVKISRVDGISEDILECFYENISYTPFIHVEDEINLSARQMPKPKRALFKAASTDHLARVSREPVDPYAFILDGNLDTLRPSLKDVMNIEDTYSFPGADEPKDIEALHEAFTKSAILQIVSARSRPDAFMTPMSIDNPADSHPGLVDIKVVKVGLLWRKDPRKKRARSPWQEWGALLTSSQLYFFRDINWTKHLMSQYESQSQSPVLFEPPVSEFKPDAIMSTLDAVALIDSSYKRHKHAFLLVRHNGLEEVFLANTDADMDDWLSKLNYAATFRTKGVPLKGTVGTKYEGKRHQIPQVGPVASDKTGSKDDGDGATIASLNYVDSRLAEQMSAARQQLMAQRIAETNEKLSGCQRELDELLRNARHLQVLTPVNARARENVILAAGRMSAKLKWVRLDMWRSKCYKRFLSLDLGIDDKEPTDALKRTSYATTATKTLTSGPSQPSLARVDSGESFSTAPQGSDTVPAGSAVPFGEIINPEHLTSPPDSSDARRSSVSPSAVSFEVPFPERSQTTTSEGRERVSTPHSSLRVQTLEREPSVLSYRSRAEASSLGSPSSRFNTNISSVDDGEEQILRQSGLLGLDGLTNASKLSGLTDEADSTERPTEEKLEASAGELRGRSRRSLQRTLRDSHHGPSHQRSKKGRDSGSSIPNLDNTSGHVEGEGLSRKDTNFTLHGKKASVITFGSEWQNMSTEERLKLRKPTPSDEPRSSEPNLVGEAAESIRSTSIHSGHPPSIRSASTATARSSRFADNISSSSGIPEVPSLDALKKERTPASSSSSSDYKNNEIAGPSARYGLASSASTSASKDDTPSDGALVREDIDHIAKQEKTRHSPQEQAVGA